MAKIVLGIGTSHTGMVDTPPDKWEAHGENFDKRLKELLSHKHDGSVAPYEQLLQEAGGRFDHMVGIERFTENHRRLNHGADALAKVIAEVKPDVAIVISDDQDEMMFEDNMPMFSVYWGDTFSIRPRRARATPGTAAAAAPVATPVVNPGASDLEMDVPVDTDLGLHLIEYLVDHDFDISHSRYMKEEYGGSIGPTGYVWWKRETEPRPQGIGHGYTFVVRRLMDNKPVPIIPIIQNTCYPPNQPSPKRSYMLGKAIAKAVEAWDSDKRVMVVGSGGLSHFVLNEDLDRLALRGMQEKNGEILSTLPRPQLMSASSETLNWVVASAAVEHLDMELVDYVPSPRTPAGTGGGWAYAHWT